MSLLPNQGAQFAILAAACVLAALIAWRWLGARKADASGVQLETNGEALRTALAERDAARAELQAQRERLERAEAALHTSQKLEAVGQLTGGIAHDFNNLLQAVAGNLELIARKPDDADRVVRWSASALEAVRKGRELTGQLLAFARKQRLEVTSVRLADLVSGMRDLIEHAVAPLGQLRIERIDPSLNVEVDTLQLELAILHLAFNARDAMPEGGLLTLAAERRTGLVAPDLPSGDYVALTLSDNGSGMTPEVLRHATEPFFTTRQTGEGTGMGLSMAVAVLHQFGGGLTIDSEEGKGTQVTLFLRVASQAPSRAAPEDESADERISLHGCRIALVDDNDGVRGAMMEMLANAGAQVVEARSGMEGIELVASVSPHLLIVDYAMPGMSGGEVLHHVRARRPDLPVVLVTGLAMPESLQAAAGEKVLVLRKPLEAQELLRAIANLLGRRENRSSRI